MPISGQVVDYFLEKSVTTYESFHSTSYPNAVTQTQLLKRSYQNGFTQMQLPKCSYENGVTQIQYPNAVTQNAVTAKCSYPNAAT